MLYSPENHRFIYAGLPHAYVPNKAPPQHKKQHKTGLSWLFSFIGMVLADVIINIVFAVVDIVVGVFTGGTAEAPLIAGEVALDDTIFAAEGAAEGAEGVTEATEATEATSEAAKTTFGWSSRATRAAVKAGAKKFFNKEIQVQGAKFTSSWVGRFLRPLLLGFASQAASGISYDSDSKSFGYNRAVWTNTYSYLFNFLFVGSAIAHGLRRTFGRMAFNTFQKWLASSAKYIKPEFKNAAREIQKLLYKNNVGKIGVTVKGLKGYGLGFLLRNYKILGLTKEEELVVESFKKGMQDAKLYGYGRIYLKIVNIYAKVFTITPKTVLGRQIRNVYDFFFTKVSKKAFITLEQYNILFDKYWLNISKGNYSGTTYEDWLRSVEGITAKNTARILFEKQYGLFKRFDYIINDAKRKVYTFKGYEYYWQAGILGKLLRSVKSTERFIEFRLTHYNMAKRDIKGIRNTLQSWVNYAYGLTGGAYIDAFETYIFQFATSPFYALDYLAFKLPRLLRINKMIRYLFEKIVTNKIDKVFAKGLLEGKYNVEFLRKVRNAYLLRTISKEEVYRIIFANRDIRQVFIKRPDEYFSEFLDKRLRRIRNSRVVRRALFLEEDKSPKWNRAMLLKKLRALPNFIEFRYSTILGVVFDHRTTSGGFSKYEITENKGINTQQGFKSVLSIAWTIFFSPTTKKPAIYQVRVPQKIVKGFVRSGLTGNPYPWVYYNRFIAWGPLVSEFGKSIGRAFFQSLPHLAGPVRFYGLDIASLKDTIQHNEYQKIFTGKKLQPKNLEKIASYGAFKNVFGLTNRNRYLGAFRLGSLGGTMSSSFISSINSKKAQTSRVGRRVNKLTYYRFARAR